MSILNLQFEVGNQDGTRFVSVNGLVDTGASYTYFPRTILQDLAVQPDEEREFILADGRHVFYAMAWTRVRLEGREMPTPVVFANPDSEPLLGAVTLEEFGLGVDALNQRLIPTPAYLVGTRQADRP